MGATWGVRVVTAVAVTAFQNRYIIGSRLLFPIRPEQAHNRQIFAFCFDRMKRRVVGVELCTLIGGFQRQVGAFGMAEVTELKLLGNRGGKIADPLTPQSRKRIGAGNKMRAVAVRALGMPRCGWIGFGQDLFRTVNTALVEHRMTIVFGKSLLISLSRLV